MADDESRCLDDGQRECLRTIIRGCRTAHAQEARWVDHLETALDDADYWRSRASNPTADDSELQGELDTLLRFREQDRSKLFYLEAQAARIEVSLSNEGLDAVTWGSIADRVELLSGKQLVNQLTAERAKVAELDRQIGDISRALLLSPCPSCDKLEDGITWLSGELRAERAKVADFEKRLYDTTTAATRDVSDLVHQLETANAANARRAEEHDGELDSALKERDDLEETCDALAAAIATHLGIDIGEHSNLNEPWAVALNAIESAGAHRAEESQLEPVGFVQRQAELGAAFLTYDGKPHAFEPNKQNIIVLGHLVKDGERCQLFAGKAEPLEVTQ